MAVLALLGAVSAPALVALMWPHEDQQATVVLVGSVDEVVASQVVYLEAHRVFVVATDLGFLAFSDDARYAGDRVLYCAIDNTFSSPVHGGRFDQVGRYLEGPGAGDLGRYGTVVKDDHVLVDLADFELPERSAARDQPSTARCTGSEGPSGFYNDGGF